MLITAPLTIGADCLGKLNALPVQLKPRLKCIKRKRRGLGRNPTAKMGAGETDGGAKGRREMDCREE